LTARRRIRTTSTSCFFPWRHKLGRSSTYKYGKTVQTNRATSVGVNIIAAQSDDEARRLATTQQISVADRFRGIRGLLRPPIDDIETYWSPQEKVQTLNKLARSIIGSPATVRAGMDALIAETSADELIIVSDVFDHEARLRSFELITAA
jgi:alkanesulfonate monooxygenase SsuD/methylene tetrahydromethanopterin reductase-like flavin-dependent oxidoreductase (luciferase family)